MNFTFSKNDRIRKGGEYSYLKYNGKVFKTRKLIFNYTESEHARLGVIVTKKVGNAVFRNRVRRWCREVFRVKRSLLIKSIDLVIIPRCSDLSFDSIERDFLYFMRWYNEKITDKPD